MILAEQLYRSPEGDTVARLLFDYYAVVVESACYPPEALDCETFPDDAYVYIEWTPFEDKSQLLRAILRAPQEYVAKGWQPIAACHRNGVSTNPITGESTDSRRFETGE